MSKWAVVENGKVTEYYDVMPESWKNVSNIHGLENDLTTLLILGWYPVNDITQPINQNTQTYGPLEWTIDTTNNVVIKNHPIINLPPTPFEVLRANFMITLRSQRDEYLAKSDWTQLSDVQAIKNNEWKNAWVTYRQTLRDLPGVYDRDYPTETNIANIVYPSEPTGI